MSVCVLEWMVWHLQSFILHIQNKTFTVGTLISVAVVNCMIRERCSRAMSSREDGCK